MGIGSGLGSSIGIAPEVTYGTYVAPVQWIEGTSSLRGSKTTYQGGGSAAGRMVRPGSRRVVVARGASGSLSTGWYNKGMGRLLNALMGGVVTPIQQGATDAYLQTHTLQDPYGKSLTIQAGVPDLGGTVHPYTYLGCQVTALEMSCETSGEVSTSWQIEARTVSEGQTLAAPSYVSVSEFNFAQTTLLLGTYGAEVPVDGVKSVNLRIERQRHPGGPYMGSGGLRSQGVLNDWSQISGTIATDFIDKEAFADRFVTDEPVSLVWEFIGPEIDTGENETLRVTLPMIFFDGDTPTAEGQDVVSPSFPFVAQHDGTHSAVTIELISTDVTL